MMKLAKAIAMVSTALTMALCLAGGASSQATPAAHRPPQAATAKAPAAGHKAMHAAHASHMATKPAAPKPAPEKPVAKAEPSPGMTASPDEAPAASPADVIAGRRDPFVSLVNDRKEGGGPALPPGKAGLVVATVRVDGTVKSGDELIAVVSNPERHVYFVRQGDQLYDGTVERIDLDGVTFQEDSKDAFGKPVVRQVTKRIYASAGEQQ
ncbi:MAG TPA: hypothetical protein VMB47_00470 [Candidatus Aquilonibacter sp.]|nr:hypothetical protein [Candidatus Aquilonibacter sp.]